jgi:hypothetical protein
MTEPDQTEFDILAIADGVTEDGHLRISLSVSPNAFTSTGTVGDFPKHARSHVSTISIEIAKGLEVVHSFPSDAISVTRTTDGEGPSTLWKKIFPDAEALCNALKPDQKPPRKDGSEVRSPFVPTVLFSELTKQRLLAPQATSRPAIGSPGPLHKSLIADLAASDAEMLPDGSSSGQSIAQTLTPNTVAALLAKGRKSLARNDKDAFEEELAVGSAAALRALLQALGMPNGRLPQKTSAPDEEETPEGPIRPWQHILGSPSISRLPPPILFPPANTPSSSQVSAFPSGTTRKENSFCHYLHRRPTSAMFPQIPPPYEMAS